MTNYLEVLQGH